MYNLGVYFELQLENRQQTNRREPPLQKSVSQQSIPVSAHSGTLPAAKSSTSLNKASQESNTEIIEVCVRLLHFFAQM